MFFETNTCVLEVSSALSFGVVPARNLVLFQIIISRKLPPPARFILPGVVFHREGQPRAAYALVPRVPSLIRSTRDTRALAREGISSIDKLTNKLIDKSSASFAHYHIC